MLRMGPFHAAAAPIACRRTLPHMQRLLEDLENGLKELE